MPQMHLVWLVADAVWDEEGQVCAVTSGLEGTHKARSKHYTGAALDLRTHYFGPDAIQRVATRLRDILGSDYDVVVEATHIHVEYDPKVA